MASRGVVSRADLLRGLLEHPGGIPTALLDQLGFEHAPIYREAPSETHHAEAESVFSATAPSRNDTDPALQPFAAVPFWRATHFEREADAPDAIQHPERRPEAPTRPLSVAPLQPLCDWKSLYPRIRQMLSAPRPGYRLDEPEVVRRLGQAEALHDWPRRTQRGWGNGLYVVEDRSRHLTPYRRDQGWVSQRLSAHYAKTEFAQALFFPGMSAPMQALGYGEDGRTRFAPMMLRAGDRVLVLGDLGVLHRDPAAMRVWQRFGRRLKAQGAHGIALVPFAPARCPIELRPYFDLLSWEYPDPPWLDEEDRERHGESLLDRLALIGCVDPAILRALRLAQRHPSLPAAIESWIWQHESQAEADTVSTAIRDDQVRQRRDRLASQPEAVAQALAAIARSGQAVPYTFLIEAAISHAGVLDRVSEGEGARRLLKRALSDAPQLFDYIGGSLNATEGSGLPGHERAYLDGLQQRLPDEVRTDPRYRHACRLLDNAARAWREDREPPRPLKAPRNIEIDQRGDQFRCRWQEPGVVRASPLATLRSRDGQIEFELDSEDRFWKDGIAPAWVDICGYDEYGPWVEFTVDGVTQRMRWIPPGRFLMGSPEDEPGRYSDEGPQHEVTVEQGFWMFDTPVTQALWEVVMTDNPAKFRSPTRPVESVRWEDAQTFIERLNERLPGLVLELPSEARWEYACRAGTDTALYSGPIEILGENNAPALDAIAWYGGNSGVGFELDNGWDSSEWPERQYPHDKAGTRPVGMKAANDWGLFDMLGNVDEWVADAWYGYDGKPADAGARQGEAGGGRVVRGGSWRGDARSVRCAVRFRFLPGLRGGLLGFRCARVQGGAEPATDGAARQAERRVHSPGRGGAAGRADARRFGVHLRLDAPADGAGAEIPDAPRLIVRTDLERLVLERLPRDTQWADEMGRDRHGLWAEFEYRGVRQRLRWIPPGRFQMGSPGDEPGRMEREGPQHEVTLARGYWLFDTPVTQALWMAVMGDNPARFQSPTRPVEQVDFVATKQFIDRINATVPALGLVLPSEAQWEYASRAGTQTALYSGSIDILGVNNAPALDSIAWYGGNSGVGFELDNGVDVTGFSDRQYPQYKKAGTHPVKGKAPNPWGLYDMLANVWEWTEDGWHENYAGAPNDGAVWEGKAGGLRVVRGGSWYDYARNVRCAIRYHSHPGSRDGLLGFRCARVQA